MDGAGAAAALGFMLKHGEVLVVTGEAVDLSEEDHEPTAPPPAAPQCVLQSPLCFTGAAPRETWPCSVLLAHQVRSK